MLKIKKKSTLPREFSPLEHIQPQQKEPIPTVQQSAPSVVTKEAKEAKEATPRVLMVAGQKYEVKVVNGKRLMEPIASPLPLRKPLKRQREKERNGEENVETRKELMECSEAMKPMEEEAGESIESFKPMDESKTSEKPKDK